MFFTYPSNHLTQNLIVKLIEEGKQPLFFFLISVYTNIHQLLSVHLIIADIHLNINIPTIHRKYCGNVPQPGMMSEVDVGGNLLSQAHIPLDGGAV